MSICRHVVNPLCILVAIITPLSQTSTREQSACQKMLFCKRMEKQCVSIVQVCKPSVCTIAVLHASQARAWRSCCGSGPHEIIVLELNIGFCHLLQDQKGRQQISFNICVVFNTRCNFLTSN